MSAISARTKTCLKSCYLKLLRLPWESIINKCNPATFLFKANMFYVSLLRSLSFQLRARVKIFNCKSFYPLLIQVTAEKIERAFTSMQLFDENDTYRSSKLKTCKCWSLHFNANFWRRWYRSSKLKLCKN